MNLKHKEAVEGLQKWIAETVAANPVGRNVLLIGGSPRSEVEESGRPAGDHKGMH